MPPPSRSFPSFRRPPASGSIRGSWAGLLWIMAVAIAGAQPVMRRALTTLTLPTEPPATGYATVRAFPELSFVQPVALVAPPGETRRLFVVEKPGRIWLIPDVTAPTPTRTLFLDLTSRVTTSSDATDERGLLALAFHPYYATNGYFYLWYTTTATTSAGSGLHDRLSRFRVASTNPNVADLASEQPLLSQRDEAGNHNGGQLLFGPDGYLYLSLGDEGGGDDAYQNSQRINKDFFAGILRLDVDLRPGSLLPNAHAAVHAGTYTVPPDNPWVGATSFNGTAVNPASVRTEFWAVGLRNPWRMAFDPANGNLWCGDVGQNAREEIDLIVRGGNYGWNYREGTLAGPRANPPSGAAFLPPIWDYAHDTGTSITGGLVYRGSRYAGLLGHYLFADFGSGRVWSLRPDGANPVTADRVQLLATEAGISSFGLDPATGEILLADLLDGTLRRLVANATPGTPALPATLSATGAFARLTDLTPATGLVSYEPQVSFWSDHAQKRRWFGLRGTEETFGFAADGPWTLPSGAVWVKHFDLETTRGDPSTARRIETRFLLKSATGAYGLTYRWNEAQTDATLVPDEGAEQTFTITENGVARVQTWRFPSRAECLACHTSAGGFALSFNTRQLNRVHPFPNGSASIISALAQAGYLDTSTPPSPSTLPALAQPQDLSQSLERRARSYLDANCSQCHQPGGTALGHWDARASTPLTAANLLNGTLVDNGGDPANRVIVPGDVAHSRLTQRMAAADASRMPPIGTRERDLEGERVLNQWIASLGSTVSPRALVNVAARAEVGGLSQALITGFAIAGPGSQRVLVRAVGPRLSTYGVPTPVARPVLTLYEGNRPLAINAGWNSAANAADIRDVAARVGAFALAEGSADSSLLLTLPAGGYTAIASSAVPDAGGVGLIEVYEADPLDSSRLINLSVRAQVGTGASILIPGLSIGAGAAKTVLIRAVGPGLAAFGVTDLLAHPVLELFNGSQSVATNTRWNTAANADAIRATAAQVGAFALSEGSADSALLVTLAPGGYTLQVRGAEDHTGVILVETYVKPD